MFGFGQDKRRIIELQQELEQCRLELQQVRDELAKRIEFDDENQKIKSIANHLIANNALILDIETTGITPNSQILELAIIDVSGNVLFNHLIKPKRKMRKDNQSISIHGITNTLLVYAPEWDDIYEQVANIIANRQMLVFNRYFVEPILLNTCQRYGLLLPEYSIHCAMELYAHWYGHLSSFCLYRHYSLADAMTFIYGGYWQQAHRALPDCQAILDLLVFVSKNNIRPRFFHSKE